MRSATSSGKCRTLCNSSNSPGNVWIDVDDDDDAAGALDIGVSFVSATEKKKFKTQHF